MGRLGGRKLSLLALVALLSLALVSCGGDDDSTSTEAAATGSPSGGATAGDDAADKGGKEEDATESGSGSPDDAAAGSDGGDSADAPVQHDDSGGGSTQYRVKGGDNSVQEFGSEADEEEFDEAAAAVHGFFDARIRGDWEAACSYLASDVTASLKQITGNSKELQGADCATVLETISQGAPQSAFKAAAVADIGSLRVEGGRAFVLYRGSGGTVFAMPMKNEDGSWKLGSLAGTPIS